MPDCKNCGAKIEYESSSQSLKCPYCNTVNTIPKAEDQLPTIVEKIIPMTVRLDDLEKRVHAFMASGNYTPDDMLEASTITKREFFYAPAYIFNIEYKATWTASFGYDRKEAYTDYRNVTRNGRQVREAYTAYKTVTDWQPHNGVDIGVFSVSTYAGKSLHESDLSPSDLVPNAIKNGSITEFNPSFMENVRAEGFSVTESNAFKSLDGEITANIDHSVKNHAQGDHQRDWHWKATMSHSENTVSVPICHAVFDYKGTEYHYWIDGIGSTEFHANKLPEDDQKKKQVKLGFVPVGVAITWLVATSYFWAFTLIGLIIAGILGGYAALRRKSIIDYSTKIRSALLTQMHASSINTKELSNEEQEKLAHAFQRPEKPLFAKTHKDKILLPVLSLVALLGIGIPSIITNQTSSVSPRSSSTSVNELKSGQLNGLGTSTSHVAPETSSIADDQPLKIGTTTIYKDRIESVGTGAPPSLLMGDIEKAKIAATTAAMIDALRNFSEVLYDMKANISNYESGEYLKIINKKYDEASEREKQIAQARKDYDRCNLYAPLINNFSPKSTVTKDGDITVHSTNSSVSGKFTLSSFTKVKDTTIESDNISLNIDKVELVVKDFVMVSKDFLNHENSIKLLYKELGFQIPIKHLSDGTAEVKILFYR